MTRAEWFGLGIAGLTLGIVGTIVILSEKKASAASASSPAAAMNNAISQRGLNKLDMPLYVAFGQSVGLPLDSQSPPELFPGPQTIAALTKALQAEGLSLSPRALASNGHAFPWLPGTGCAGYDGTNAPAAAQWDPTGVC